MSSTAREILTDLSDRTGRPASELLDAAVAAFQRSLAAVLPVSSIPGVNPADLWEAAAQADAGQLTSHGEVFGKLRSRP